MSWPYQDRKTSASARHHDLFEKTHSSSENHELKLELGPGYDIARLQSAIATGDTLIWGAPPWHVSLKKETWKCQRDKRRGPLRWSGESKHARKYTPMVWTLQ